MYVVGVLQRERRRRRGAEFRVKLGTAKEEGAKLRKHARSSKQIAALGQAVVDNALLITHEQRKQVGQPGAWVHSHRLQAMKEAKIEVVEQKKLQGRRHSGRLLGEYSVDRIVDEHMCRSNGELGIQVVWRGYEHEDGWTWELLGAVDDTEAYDKWLLARPEAGACA